MLCNLFNFLSRYFPLSVFYSYLAFEVWFSNIQTIFISFYSILSFINLFLTGLFTFFGFRNNILFLESGGLKYISLTATLYISFDFFSSCYLDVSIHKVLF